MNGDGIMTQAELYLRINDPDEIPLSDFAQDGGYCPILRTIGCVGDSLSSGEFESEDEEGNKGYHDYFDYSWGQFLARDCGCTVYNFSRGGMTAKEYMESFAQENGFWSEQKACRAYILALGVNDINSGMPLGSKDDINLSDWRLNGKTFAGYYGGIVQRLLEISPKARFFFVSAPKNEKGTAFPGHTQLLYDLTKVFPFSYVIDLDAYAPPHDEAFRQIFYLGGHLNAAGYRLTAKQIESYIDWIIRHNPEDFTQIGFVCTDYHNVNAKW